MFVGMGQPPGRPQPTIDASTSAKGDGGINKKLSSTFLPMRSLNKARTSSASLNVYRLRVAVITRARLTFADMAADSGVLLGIILVRSSFAIPTGTAAYVRPFSRSARSVRTECL